jgi:hypothetical protein
VWGQPVPVRSKKGNKMRKLVSLLAAAVLLSALPVTAQNRAKNSSEQIVIVFKDGHHQSFNLADIARIEFPGGASAADSSTTPPGAPPRGHFIGKWEVGDGSGGTFYITLNEDGSAWRTLNRSHGRWAYVNGEARVTWDDGAQDAIRRVGGEDKKSAYRAGKYFTDQPDNVTQAHNTTRGPA